jgi:two-component system, cell cycle sensor histidine kinase and response regulator CckA
VAELDRDELLDHLTESVSVYDREARLRYINAAGATLFARPRSELLGSRPWDLVPAAPVGPFQTGLLAVLAGGERRTIVTFVRAFERWFECDIYPVPEGALAVARDITQPKLADERLRQSEARFRAMVDYAPEAIVIYDVSARSFTVANAAAERLSGLPRDELLKKGLLELSANKQPDGASGAGAEERLRAYIEEALKGGTPEFEWVIRNARGQEIPCEVRLLLLPQDDRQLIRGSVTDISARKRLQDQLAQSQRLEALGRLAGGVAHDFNNMMTVVLGTAESLMARLPPGDSMRAELADITGAAERATLVTRQLLAFGRRQRLAPLLVDLSAHVEHLNRVLQRVVGEDIELELNLARPLGVVRADVGQIEQVVLNLVVNARDAMPGGGCVTLQTANVTVSEEYEPLHDGVPPGRYVVFSVGDKGEGMTDTVRAHLFEPFFTTKELGRGTGLGLATVHGIVEQSGGHIRVDSELGKGSTFKVYLPRVDGAEAQLSEPPPSAGSRYAGRETILLVEDEASVRHYCRKALQRGGYTVLEASNGGEALLIVEQHPGSIDLLLTDVVMPRMTGPQLAARLRAIRGPLRAVYMSGYTEDRLTDQGGLGPNDTFVQKPVGPENLLRCVRVALDGSKSLL